MKIKTYRFAAAVAVLLALLVFVAPVAATNESKIGTVEYATLAEAIDAAKANDVVTMLIDNTSASTISINKTIILDLNGTTINNTGNDWVLKVDNNSVLTLTDNSEAADGNITGLKGISIVKGSKLIMNGGNIVATGTGVNDPGIQIYGSEATMNGGTITAARFGISIFSYNNDVRGIFTMNGGNIVVTGVEDSAGIQIYGSEATMNGGTITAAESEAILIFTYNDVRGILTMNGGELYSKVSAIRSHGSDDKDDVDVTINGGTLYSDEAAIYWPAAGKLTINGGTLSGETAVYFKSGSLTITGGELVGNGEKADYIYYGNGWVDTGDALVIENVNACGYEGISVSITGGTFTSTYAKAVASYVPADNSIYQVDKEGNTAELSSHQNYSELMSASRMTAFITGGTFSSNPSAYIAPGMEVVQPGNSYLVQKYVDRSSSSSSSKPVEEPEQPEQPEEPVVEPETPAAPGEATVETEVTDGGEVEFEAPVEEPGVEGGSAAADEDEAKITGVVLPTGTDSEVTFVPVSEQPAPAGQEENTKKVFEINVPTYEKGKPATIKFTMTVAELEADGKEAADVALWHFDEETGEWTKLVTSYTIVDGVVYFEAITNDFSPFAIIYEDEPVDEPVEEPETPASPAPVLGLLAALGAAVVLRRK